MTKKGIANKAAIQSARAKLNKALAAGEGILGAAQIASINSVIGWCNTQLAAKVTKLEPVVAESVSFEDAVEDGGAAATDEADNSGADLAAVAWALRLNELTATA